MAGGRQREFCKTNALEKAMKVFWKKGYVGASLSDLTNGMGINKPSMYAAFGNKEQLFIEATNYYIEHYAKPHNEHLHSDKPLKQRLVDYLTSVLQGQSCKNDPKGCFVSMSVSECEGGSIPVEATELIEEARDYAEEMLTQFFNDEIERGHLTQTSEVSSMARFMVTVMHGTAALTRGGKSAKELKPVIDLAVEGVLSSSL